MPKATSPTTDQAVLPEVQTSAPAAPVAIFAPAKGGSYIRDPETGALTQVQETVAAPPDLRTDPADTADEEKAI